MTTQVTVQDWILECDVEATRAAYAQTPLGDPETCGCLDCRNFAAARHLVYPPAALELYARLGISPDREAETYECGTGPEVSPIHFYGGWHHFVGHIRQTGTSVKLTERFSVTFAEFDGLAKPAFAGLPLVQVDFIAQVPWVLSEPAPVIKPRKPNTMRICAVLALAAAVVLLIVSIALWQVFQMPMGRAMTLYASVPVAVLGIVAYWLVLLRRRVSRWAGFRRRQ